MWFSEPKMVPDSHSARGDSAKPTPSAPCRRSLSTSSYETQPCSLRYRPAPRTRSMWGLFFFDTRTSTCPISCQLRRAAPCRGDAMGVRHVAGPNRRVGRATLMIACQSASRSRSRPSNCPSSARARMHLSLLPLSGDDAGYPAQLSPCTGRSCLCCLLFMLFMQ